MSTRDHEPTNEALSEPARQRHEVLFHDKPHFLCEKVADFLCDGFRSGESLVVVAVDTREPELSSALDGRGIDVNAAVRTGRFAFLDAQTTLANIMSDGRPDWTRFQSVVGRAIEIGAAASLNGRVRAFGEMVGLLQSQGNTDSAIALEEMWNRLQESHEVSLLCAYDLTGTQDQRVVQRICATHVEVHPLDRDLRESTASAPDVRALVDEISRRSRVEAALRDSIRNLTQIEAELRRSQRETERLARITSAIADAVTPEQIAEAIVDEVAATVCASSGALWTLSGGNATLVRSVGYSEALVRSVASIPLDAPARAPIVDVLLKGVPVWIESREELLRWYPNLPVPVTPNRNYRIACLPLLIQGATYGVLAFVFDDAPPLDADAKRFLNLIARHSGQALERLRLLSDLKETVRFNHMFTAILGHDLRNPLAAIMSSAYVAGRRDAEGKLAKPLSRIVKAGSRMARMIDQLLDFTRVRVGAGIPLQLASVDLVSLLETTIDELEGANPDSKFELVAEGELRGLWDADRLCQVFSNLLGNAMAHGDRAHGVRVSVECPSPDRVLVSVHNEGAIPPEFLERIFDPMVEASLRRERPSGLGLGLFISREITKAHGGTIAIHSNEADGTTFVVSLPRDVAPRQAADP